MILIRTIGERYGMSQITGASVKNIILCYYTSLCNFGPGLVDSALGCFHLLF